MPNVPWNFEYTKCNISEWETWKKQNGSISLEQGRWPILFKTDMITHTYVEYSPMHDFKSKKKNAAKWSINMSILITHENPVMMLALTVIENAKCDKTSSKWLQIIFGNKYGLD